MSSSGAEMLTIIQGILSIVMLVVFFVMASNIGQIKKKLESTRSGSNLVSEGDKFVFCGNIEKASELYHLAAYRAINSKNMVTSEKNKTILEIADKISNSGGIASKALLMYVEKNCRR